MFEMWRITLPCEHNLWSTCRTSIGWSIFQRLVARQGLPSTVWSDNAKTFKAISKEIQKIVHSPRVLNYLTNHCVAWKFIVEWAPWWGGFWECMVCSVKQCLRKYIGRSSLNRNELNTLLIEVESVLNSRLLTYVHIWWFWRYQLYTYPSHLIYRRKIANIPNIGHHKVFSTSSSLTRRAKRYFTLLSHFTKQWQTSTFWVCEKHILLTTSHLLRNW